MYAFGKETACRNVAAVLDVDGAAAAGGGGNDALRIAAERPNPATAEDSDVAVVFIGAAEYALGVPSPCGDAAAMED